MSVHLGDEPLCLKGGIMTDNRKYLPEIVKRIRQTNPHKIILFGSSAAGVCPEDSDLDLFMILDSPQIAELY